MRNTACLLFLFVFPALFFALDSYQLSYITNVNKMISNRSFLNDNGVQELQKKTIYLPLETRSNYYVKNQIDTSSPVLSYNIFLPSLGSWMIGDTFGAIGIDVGLGCSILLFWWGSTQVNGGIKSTAAAMGLGAYILAGVNLVVFYIVNITLPYSYADKYNEKLRKGLNITGIDHRASERFAFDPGFEKHDAQLIQFDLVQIAF